MGAWLSATCGRRAHLDRIRALGTAPVLSRASPLWPAGRTGELPGRRRLRVLSKLHREGQRARSHASQPSPACCVQSFQKEGCPEAPSAPPQPAPAGSAGLKRVPAVTHPLSLLLTRPAQPPAARLSPLDWRQSPGRSSDIRAASNSVNRFAQGIRYALKEFRPRGEGP